MRKFKFSLVFTAFIFLGLSRVYAQPANSMPFVKYAINNYSTISKAACDTCEPLVGKALQRFRPIPLPLAAAADALPGVSVDVIPGLSAPNFHLGGSPEIKGLVQEAAGMTDNYAEYVRKTDILYFRSGAQGVAVSKTGRIFTSSSTFLPGVKFNTPLGPDMGFFSFKSTPAILPTFNDRSEEAFVKSPDKVVFEGEEIDNDNKEIAYFALHPANENIVYAAFENSVTGTKILARKNRAGDWQQLDWDMPGGLAVGVWGALAVDSDGSLYVADADHHVIVKVTIDEYEGTAKTWQIIGGKMDTPDFVNSDEDGQDARFNKPSGICVDAAGNIYIGDAGNNVIRIIESDGDVETYAGNEEGKAGSADDGLLTSAKFSGPTAVAYNEVTKMLYVVDATNKTIREINKDKKVSTLAGHAVSTSPEGIFMGLYYYLAKLNMNPGEHLFSNPTGIAIDPSGLGLYVSDGKYIKYVNSSEAIFTITAAFGDSNAYIGGIPILPLGIKMNSSNGAFYGVPLVPWKPTTYTISIANHVTAKSLLFPPAGFITFEVVDCPEKTDTVVINKTISRKELPYTWNGKTLSDAGTAAVTAQTLTGCDSVTVLNLSISPELYYNTEPYILSFGQQIKPIVPTTAGSKIETFSVTPPLPAGLLLNAQTGEITGTPTVYVPGQPVPAVGSRTPPQYPAPWTLIADKGADLTEVKISDGNGKVLFENNSAFGSLQGTAGTGTGTAGAYTDYSVLGAIKLYSNTRYPIRLANALKPQSGFTRSMNEYMSYYNFMNSYAVYIDYNRDGDFADAGERAYISAGPQSDAHAEGFNLNIPASASAGVTKMRIYAVEARTDRTSYMFYDPSRGLADQFWWVYRTTEQALSFYPNFNDISNYNGSGETDFHDNLDYGEFEDYNIDIITPPTQGYVVNGTNAFGSAQSTIKLAVSKPTSSTTNLTICSTQLPYTWNNLIFTGAGTKTDTLKNQYAADSLATLNLVVKQASRSEIALAHCGPYNFHGQMLTISGLYGATIPNAVGCDSLIYLTFRQKATGSVTNEEITPAQLPYTWNGIKINTAGTYYDTIPNKENCDSIATLKLLVQYDIYYTTNNLLTMGMPIAPITPQFEGDYQYSWQLDKAGYSISPALPTGLAIDSRTGVITGTPTQLSPLQRYTVTLGQDGAKPTTFNLAVGEPSFSTTTIDNCGPLLWNGVEYEEAGTFTAPLKNHYGFDSTATLILSIRNLSASTTILNLTPAQLPFTWNDTSITKEGLHTIHLVNAVGCDSAATADVVISPKIFYTSPQILHPGQLITPVTPQDSGGKVLNYIIQPALVNGLEFNAITGTLTGTPSDTLIQPVTHTITATNRAGTNTTTLVVAVCNPIATSFTNDICDQFVWNDSTYTSSTTHTRVLKNRGGCDSTVTMNLIIRKSSKGATTTITACSNYVWYGATYDKTGIYTKLFTNAVGCDSTLTLNLTVNYPSVNNLYVNLNASDLPYKWRNKTFSAPGSDTILLRNGNSVGCDSSVRMTVSISALLPDITYAVTDTVLYWDKSITTPIAMSNAGTPVPAMKLGQTDTVMKLSNSGPGINMRNAVKGPDGAYYASEAFTSKLFKLDNTGAWTEFANVGWEWINGVTIDKAGNLYVAHGGNITKFIDGAEVGRVDGNAYWNVEMVSVDTDNIMTIVGKGKDNNLRITKLNLSTNVVLGVQTGADISSYYKQDIKVDSKGNIYVVALNENTVLKIKPDGRRSTIGSDATYRNRFKAGNGPDAEIPNYIKSMTIDPTNDNVYLMAYGQILRVDTAENVTQVTGTWFDQSKDHIFRVENGKISIINNTTRALFTANVYGVSSLPFMNNYGLVALSFSYDPATGVNYTDFDKRIRLDSSGAIVGTPRAMYSSIGTNYADNNSTAYAIIAANQHGISTAPMVITVKDITYKRESFVTTTLPFVWRGRSFTAATDTATYFVPNRNWVRESPADDTMYMLHLVYEGPPEPVITSNCVTGGVSLTATGAAKSAISFDGTNMGVIQNTEQRLIGGLPYYGADWTKKPDGSTIVYFHSAFEVWIKPATVNGIQYLLTRDTVKTNGVFFGYSIQNGKFVYEFTKGITKPFVDYKLSSVSNIEPNVWTHVAASFYDSTMHIFINGKLEGSLQTADRFIGVFYQAPDGAGVFPDFSLAGLGHQLGYKGEMDELRLFSTRRNADSIKATMNTLLDPLRGGLGLYYRFDGDVKNSASDNSLLGRSAVFIKPAASIDSSGAPINFASYKWMPGGETTKSVIAKPTSNTLYTVTVQDYKGTSASASLLVYPAQGPTITAPAAVAKFNSPSSCTVVISDAELGAATAMDNCPGVTVTRTGVPSGNIFPVGITTITYTAVSINGLTKSATQTVTVTDITKPIFTTALSAPSVVWPPDHKLKDVALTYTTADLCGTVTNRITVTSTDPISGVSDGDKSPDWVVVNDHLVQLRAERGNGREARVYTITVTPVDEYGNEGLPKSTTVTIAHNITGPVTGTSFKIGSTVAFSGVFWDKAGNKHTGQWVIDDNTLVKGIVTEPSGTRNGKVTGSYKFTTAGTYKLRMNVTDQNKVTSYCNTNEDMEAIVVIYDPNGGYTYGGGWFASPAGALKSDATATGKANFGYAVNYFKGAANPKGETQFELKVGDFEYNALNFEYLSVAGARAQFKGTGKIMGGQSGIDFIMTVIDGALDGTGIDKVRIKIYNRNTGQVYYDNEGGSDANNPVTKVSTNSQIVIGGTYVNTISPAATVTMNQQAPKAAVSVVNAQRFELKAFPNPTTSQFSVQVQSSGKEPIGLRVIDVHGRIIETINRVVDGQTVQIGRDYRPGVYLVEMIQGSKRKQVKLIKQAY